MFVVHHKFFGVVFNLALSIILHQLACPSFALESPEDATPALLIATHRRAYLVNISNESPATNPAGINTPPDTHLLPIIPANTAATNMERWKLEGFWEV